MQQIKGGYILKARQFQNSQLAHSTPCTREIFDWLLRKANHKKSKISGRVLERGQCYTTYKEIQEELHWKKGFIKVVYSRHDIETALKTMRITTAITTRRTTRGMIVSICNYNEYQAPKNYDNLMDNHNDNPMDNPPIVQEEKNYKKKEEKSLSCAKFEDFWRQYPSSRRVDKKACRRKWITEKLDNKIDKILAGLENHKQSEQWNDEQYIPHAKTWLNQERWETEMKPKSETSTQLQLSPPPPETKT